MLALLLPQTLASDQSSNSLACLLHSYPCHLGYKHRCTNTPRIPYLDNDCSWCTGCDVCLSLSQYVLHIILQTHYVHNHALNQSVQSSFGFDTLVLTNRERDGLLRSRAACKGPIRMAVAHRAADSMHFKSPIKINVFIF